MSKLTKSECLCCAVFTGFAQFRHTNTWHRGVLSLSQQDTRSNKLYVFFRFPPAFRSVGGKIYRCMDVGYIYRYFNTGVPSI